MFYRTGVIGYLVSYRDADWSRNGGNRRPISGYAISLGSVSFTWSSKKQTTIELASIEVEYRGVILATCKAIWLK